MITNEEFQDNIEYLKKIQNNLLLEAKKDSEVSWKATKRIIIFSPVFSDKSIKYRFSALFNIYTLNKVTAFLAKTIERGLVEYKYKDQNWKLVDPLEGYIDINDKDCQYRIKRPALIGWVSVYEDNSYGEKIFKTKQEALKSSVFAKNAIRVIEDQK